MLPKSDESSALYGMLALGDEFIREWLELSLRNGVNDMDITMECLHKVEEWEKKLLDGVKGEGVPQDIRRLTVSVVIPTAEVARLLATHESIRRALVVIVILNAVDDIILHSVLPSVVPFDEWALEHVRLAMHALMTDKEAPLYAPAHEALTRLPSLIDVTLLMIPEDVPHRQFLQELRDELIAVQQMLTPVDTPPLQTLRGVAALCGWEDEETFPAEALLPDIDWQTLLLSLDAQVHGAERIPGMLPAAKWISYITALANLTVSRARAWQYPVPPPVRVLVLGGAVPTLAEPAEAYYIDGTGDALSVWVVSPEGESPAYLMDCAAHELFPGHHFHASLLRGATVPSFFVSPHVNIFTLDSLLGNGASVVTEGWASFAELVTILRQSPTLLSDSDERRITLIEKAFAYSCLKVVERYAWVVLTALGGKEVRGEKIKLERQLMPYQLASYWLGMLLWTAVFLEEKNDLRMLKVLHQSAFPTTTMPLEEALMQAKEFITKVVTTIAG